MGYTLLDKNHNKVARTEIRIHSMCCVIIMYKNNWKDHIMRIKDTQQPKIA